MNNPASSLEVTVESKGEVARVRPALLTMPGMHAKPIYQIVIYEPRLGQIPSSPIPLLSMLND